MSEFVDFMKENYKMIAVIVIVVIFLLVIIEIKDIEMNPPKPESKLVQQVTVETFDSMSEKKANLADSFCKSYLGNSQELEGACNELTKKNCAQTSCCVFTVSKEGEEEEGKCVAGGPNGPTYRTDKDGKLITIDSYYYLGTRRR